jgi:LuxR family transcriptional regulator, quorum-sensing system regulator BjaR1
MPIRDYDRFFETTGRIAKADTIADVWALATEVTAPIGWRPGIACFLPGPRETFVETVLAHSLPQEWVERYSAERYELIDPVFDRASATRQPFTMEEAFAGKLTKRQRLLRDEAAASGFISAFVIPDFSQGRCALIAFAGPKDSLTDKGRLALHLAGVTTLNRLLLLTRSDDSENAPKLSERERECLRWVAMGKSDWEIGEILSLSEKTVNEYVERAKHKLDVPTRMQAIVRAIRLGSIRV